MLLSCRLLRNRSAAQSERTPKRLLDPDYMLKPIKIKKIRTDLSGYEEIAQVYEELSYRKSPIFDWSQCSFFDANMSAALAASTEQVVEDQFITHTHLKRGVSNILQRNLFLCRYGHPAIPDRFETTIPFGIILPNGMKEFSEYVSEIFRKDCFPRCSQALKNRISQSFLEVVNNSITHSGSTKGTYCSGQIYPNEEKLKISFVDPGVGFRRRIYQDLGVRMNSDAAIEWALKKGNTTKKGVPGGLGLDFIREFILLNGGEIMIVSDRGYWKLSAAGIVSQRLNKPFPGTAVNITINTSDRSSYSLSSE